VKSYRDLWLWLGAAFLTASAGLLAIALAYFTKIQKYSLFTSWWMLAATIVFLLAFASFYGAIKGIAFPPWEKSNFPKIRVNIYGASTTEIPRTAEGGPVDPLVTYFYKVRIINLEKEQNASLILRPFFDLSPESQGPFAEAAGSYTELKQMIGFPGFAYANTLAPNPLPETILLSPATSAEGDLVYMVPTFSWQKLADPRRLRLVIEDLVSGKSMQRMTDATMAQFTTDDMAPATPGPRILEQAQSSEKPGLETADQELADAKGDSASSPTKSRPQA
jgi:hypothetical protein